VSAPSLAFVNAAQILRPPADGLPYIRGPEADHQSLHAGGLSVADGLIKALDPGESSEMIVDATGCAIVPGFVDCHTHLPFAGWRAGEYEMKVRGVPYERIAQQGGGIKASARALSETEDERVLQQARELASEMLAAGTTTFECKSGYGLSRDGELRALHLAAQLGRAVEQTTTSTALLAHSVPAGYTADSWMDEVEAMLPQALAAAGPALTALDIFVESIAFSNAHLEWMGALARDAGLALRAHVEQFTTQRSVPVAVAQNARSVDHLSRLHPDDIEPLAASETAAVLLPAAEFLGAEHRAPARELLQAGAIVVLATDANPGTAPVVSIPLVIGLATRLYGLSTAEALAATTLNAAWTLNMHQDRGSIEAGKRADLVLLDAPAEHLAYRFGHNPVAMTFIGGEPVYVREDQAWRLTRR
jgi:imidazolonepropionase